MPKSVTVFTIVLLAFAPATASKAQDVRPGVIVVGFDSNVPAGKSGREMLARRVAERTVEPMLPWLPDVAAKRSLPPSFIALQSVRALYYDAPLPPDEVARLYAELPGVSFAEPWPILRTSDEPNDPQYTSMQHLKRLGFEAAWDVVKAGEASNVPIIAIVDNAFDIHHPDLAPNLWLNTDEVPGNGIDDDLNGYVDDVHGWNFTTDSGDLDPDGPLGGHGTAVAGVAVGVTGNQKGIAGSSWNARFMAVAAACEGEAGLICFGYSGIAYAAANGADVVNASFAGPSYSVFGNMVVTAAADAGTLVVAAAGNEAEDLDIHPSYPANLDRVLSVGATSKSAPTVAPFSNLGRSVDVFAPGIALEATAPGGTYTLASGTSFSSPLTAGLAALVRVAFPEYGPDQMAEQIRVTASGLDATNPALAGLLGRGEINPHRAVTATGLASLRLRRVEVVDSGGDGEPDSGETIQLTAVYRSYLADALDVSFELEALDPLAVVTEQPAIVARVAGGDSIAVSFVFTVDPSTPDNRLLRFYLNVAAGGYTDSEPLGLLANNSAVANLGTDLIVTSITDEGNIGCTEFCDGSPGVRGLGFRVGGSSNTLFEGGLVMGTSANRVTDTVRGLLSDPTVQNQDLRLREGTSIEVVSPGQLTDEEGRVQLVECSPGDDGCTLDDPIGIDVQQETYVDRSGGNDGFIVFRYTFTNVTNDRIEGFHAGLMFDWDVGLTNPEADYAGFDAERRLGWAQDGASPTLFVGTTLLSRDAAMNYRAIDNPSELYDGFTEAEKFAFLSEGVQRTELSSTDVSQMMSVGPYSIEAGGSVQAAFALVGARSMDDLLSAAERAQALWDTVINPERTSVEDGPEAPRLRLDPPYPNPTSQSASVVVETSTPAPVRLELVDAIGRVVVVLHDRFLEPGRHEVTWNLPAVPGTYWLRLISDGRVVGSRTLSIVR